MPKTAKIAYFSGFLEWKKCDFWRKKCEKVWNFYNKNCLKLGLQKKCQIFCAKIAFLNAFTLRGQCRYGQFYGEKWQFYLILTLILAIFGPNLAIFDPNLEEKVSYLHEKMWKKCEKS